jgi:hypothetical protein
MSQNQESASIVGRRSRFRKFSKMGSWFAIDVSIRASPNRLCENRLDAYPIKGEKLKEENLQISLYGFLLTK